MHYFKRNIGDYHKKAGRLSILEHGAYTLLMDSCYDRERFPTLEEAIEWCWARSPEEIAAIEFVLSKFFVLTDGLYVQLRVEEEIAAYQAMSLNNKRIAAEREDKRRQKKRGDSTERERSVHEAPPNHKPLTTNQEPLTNNPLVGDTAKAEAKYSDDDMTCAEFVLAGIMRVAEKTKKPNMDKWADQVRLMRESDKLTHREICEVFAWANHDSFWSTNILSITKLRQKFAALAAKKGAGNEIRNTGAGFNNGTGQGKLSTVGRNTRAAEEYLAKIRGGDTRGNDGTSLAEIG